MIVDFQGNKIVYTHHGLIPYRKAGNFESEIFMGGEIFGKYEAVTK